MKITDEQFADWMKALRSGRYKQVRGTLLGLDSDGNVLGYCCLGVLAQRRRVKGYNDMGRTCDEYEYEYIDEGPDSVYNKISELLGGKEGLYLLGVGMNDDGSSFEEIADALEAKYKELKEANV